MNGTIECKVLVVGGGPGGYVAAIRCGQLGFDTVLVDKDRVGGTCLIRGCIPSKALIHAAEQFDEMRAIAREARFGLILGSAPSLDLAATVAWKDTIVNKLNTGVASLLKRANVRTIAGSASFSDAKSCSVTTADGKLSIVAEHVILATGSVPIELPFLPFRAPVISSTDALALKELPGRLVVVGAGYIGLELGLAFCKLGVQVSIVEQQDRILLQYDEGLSEPVLRAMKSRGIALHLGARVTGMDAASKGLIIKTSGGETSILPADKILVTVGRKPATDGWGLEETGVAMNGRFVRIDERCATSTRNVWAIGDITGEPMLAHKASAQAEIVADVIAGKRRQFDPVAIPAVCFTDPEVVSVGLDLRSAEARGATVSIFPLQANGRALTLGAGGDAGFVRIVSDPNDRRLLGIQAVGRHVAELSGEFALAIEMGAVLEDIAGTIHAHPTLGEAFHETALKGLGHPLHI